MATATAPAKVEAKSEELLLELCVHLHDKGAVLIEKLPDRLRSVPLLSKALVLGYIEIGQRQYAIVSPDVRVRDVPVDGDKRITKQVVEKTFEAHVSDEWTWTDLKGPKRKQLPELMAEQTDDVPEQCRLHIKLTAAGSASML